MTAQIACFFTPVVGTGSLNPYDPYRPLFHDIKLATEQWNYSLLGLLNEIAHLHDNLPSAEIAQAHGVIDAMTVPSSPTGAAVVYVYADHTRINAAIASGNYRVMWTYTINRQAPQAATELGPLSNTLSAEVTGLRDWLATRYGVTTTAVTNWFAAKYERTPAQLTAFITANPRHDFVRRVADEITQYAQTKSELDNA